MFQAGSELRVERGDAGTCRGIRGNFRHILGALDPTARVSRLLLQLESSLALARLPACNRADGGLPYAGIEFVGIERLGCFHIPWHRSMHTDPTISQPQRTRVLCVDDSPDITKMLFTFSRGYPDLEDASTLDNAEESLGEVVRRSTDVVVLQVSMPDEMPLESIRALAKQVSSFRVIAFSRYDHAATRAAAKLARTMKLFGKRSEPDEIIHALWRVARERATRLGSTLNLPAKSPEPHQLRTNP